MKMKSPAYSNETFFVIIGGGNILDHRFADEEVALEEAERLAAISPIGKEFYVAKTVKRVFKVAPKVVSETVKEKDSMPLTLNKDGKVVFTPNEPIASLEFTGGSFKSTDISRNDLAVRIYNTLGCMGIGALLKIKYDDTVMEFCYSSSDTVANILDQINNNLDTDMSTADFADMWNNVMSIKESA